MRLNRNIQAAFWRTLLLPLSLLTVWAMTASAQEPPADKPKNSAAENGDAAKLNISSLDEIKSEFDNVPCKNKERLNAVKALFEKLGAASADIAIEKMGGAENLIIRKPGAPETVEQKIIVGAHYDLTGSGSCGAIDNWTGIVAIAHLYRAVKDFPLKKSVWFVAFGREEEGLIGSKSMAGRIKKEEAPQYCAMINIDSLGLTQPWVADNMSASRLTAAAEEAAQEAQLSFVHKPLPGGDSDSTSFNNKKIPALSILGLSSDWSKILHGGEDKPGKIIHANVYQGYLLALALLQRIDQADCQAYREPPKQKK
jgi:hypothetical protein